MGVTHDQMVKIRSEGGWWMRSGRRGSKEVLRWAYYRPNGHQPRKKNERQR